MSLSSRFVVQSTVTLLAVGFLTLLAIVGMTIWLNERAQIYFDEVVAARDLRTSAVELRSALQAAEASQRGYLFTDNEIYLSPYDAAKASTLRHLDRLRDMLAHDPQSQVMLDRLSFLTAEKVAEMDRSIALKNDRRDDDVMALIRTNRGKALMDEANVFLSGIIEQADARLIMGVSEQRTNAARLRWMSIIGGVLIVLVVGGAILTVARYTREVTQARDEVRALNAGLEDRVQARTADLAQARNRAEMLLAEVNHRVANSLAMVSSLVKLQANALGNHAAKEALDETYARIFAIASVHKRLYSTSDVRYVALDEYLPGVLDQLSTSMRSEGLGAWLKYDIEPVKLRTDASVNLGVVVTEWVTNAFKYAYPGKSGEVRVRLKALDDSRAELVVEDDGVGRQPGRPNQGTGLGTRLVTAMAGTMHADIEYSDRQPGTKARLVFPLLAA
jgi:two-component sensor histidine kinase